MTDSTRLERALQLFLAARARNEDPHGLLATHPDLADLLQPLCAGEATADAETAEQTIGEFRLLREVGRGGMGVVYEARQAGLDRRVALKVLSDEVGASPTQLARFHREARALARLDHLHVVRVLDFGAAAGRHWLAMEFVEGESLEQHLAGLRTAGGHAGPSRRALVEVIAQVAGALQHVHDASILHRDVKPSNILLHKDGRALLSDFGLARDAAAPAMTQLGIVAGTLHYMSPEHVAGGDALTPASDVFSLGATLYECVTLRRPFDAPTTELILRDILTRDPVDPRHGDRTVPADLAAIILRALEKAPSQRYPTARAFGDDLRAFLELRPVQARPHSALRRVRRWARRQPLQASLAAAMVAIAALAVVLLAMLPGLRRAEAARREQAYEEAITAGDLARAGGDRAASMRAFEQALALFPDRSEAVVWQCLAIGTFDGNEAALATLEAAFGTSSTDEVVERERAFLLMQLGRRDEALALDQRLGAPTTPIAMLFTAATLLQRNQPGDADRAGQLMSMAVRMSKQPRLFLYACWAGIAPPAQQEECASAILALWPDNPFAMQQAAVCLRDLDPKRGAELMARAIEGGYEMNNPRYFLAGLAWRAGDRDTALAAAREALVHDKLTDLEHSSLIDRLIRAIDPAEARTATAAWLERAPENPAALHLGARGRVADGDLKGALELLQRAVAADPADPDLSHSLARVLGQSKQYVAAADVAQRVLAASPAHRPTHRLLLDVLAALDDRAGLLAEQRRWVAVQADDGAGWLDLARLLLREGDPAANAEALQAAAQAEMLTAGKDGAVLEVRAQAHDALGEATSAQQCRARAAALPRATGK